MGMMGGGGGVTCATNNNDNKISLHIHVVRFNIIELMIAMKAHEANK